MSRKDLVASQHVESSWARDQTSVPCIGGWILIHSATWEVRIRSFSVCLVRSTLPQAQSRDGRRALKKEKSYY